MQPFLPEHRANKTATCSAVRSSWHLPGGASKPHAVHSFLRGACICTYIYVYIHTYIHTYIRTYIHLYVDIPAIMILCVDAYMCIYIYVCICISICIRASIFVCGCVKAVLALVRSWLHSLRRALVACGASVSPSWRLVFTDVDMICI